MYRLFANSARTIYSLTASYNEGIWVGRRPLFETFGASLIPGLDGYHWSIMCDGIIYQTGGKISDNIYDYGYCDTPLIKKGGNGDHGVGYDKNTIKEKDSFEWFLIEKVCPRFAIDIKQFVDTQYWGEYKLLENNCQDVVMKILAYCLDISLGKAKTKLTICVANLAI